MNNGNKENHISGLRQTKQLRYKQIAIFHQSFQYKPKNLQKINFYKGFLCFQNLRTCYSKDTGNKHFVSGRHIQHQITPGEKCLKDPPPNIKDSENKNISSSNFSMLKWM